MRKELDAGLAKHIAETLVLVLRLRVFLRCGRFRGKNKFASGLLLATHNTIRVPILLPNNIWALLLLLGLFQLLADGNINLVAALNSLARSLEPD